MRNQKLVTEHIGPQSREQKVQVQLSCVKVKSNRLHSTINISPKNNINPYLIFHSTLDEPKSLFRTNKQVQDEVVGNRDMNKQQWIDRPDKITERRLTFTENYSNIQKKSKMGMLIVTKKQLLVETRLSYCSDTRSVRKVPQCLNCGKVFQKHEAMGGHKRVCK